MATILICESTRGSESSITHDFQKGVGFSPLPPIFRPKHASFGTICFTTPFLNMARRDILEKTLLAVSGGQGNACLHGLHFEMTQQFSEALLIDRVILPRSKIPNVTAVAQLHSPGLLCLHDSQVQLKREEDRAILGNLTSRAICTSCFTQELFTASSESRSNTCSCKWMASSIRLW